MIILSLSGVYILNVHTYWVLAFLKASSYIFRFSLTLLSHKEKHLSINFIKVEPTLHLHIVKRDNIH